MSLLSDLIRFRMECVKIGVSRLPVQMKMFRRRQFKQNMKKPAFIQSNSKKRRAFIMILSLSRLQ